MIFVDYLAFLKRHPDVIGWNWDGDNVTVVFDKKTRQEHTWREFLGDSDMRRDLLHLEQLFHAAPAVRARHTLFGDWTDDVVPEGTVGRVVHADDPSAGAIGPRYYDMTVAFTNGVVFNVSSVVDVKQVDSTNGA